MKPVKDFRETGSKKNESSIERFKKLNFYAF